MKNSWSDNEPRFPRPGKTPKDDTAAVMKFYKLPPAFPAEALAESKRVARALAAEGLKDKTRLDLRKKFVFTCDPVTARDYDDALSLETDRKGNRILGVHIADVSHFVRPGSALDREAYRRSTSVYLCDRVVPMLPEELSNGVCSLVPGEDRLAFSVFMTFDKSGEMVKRTFAKSIIRSQARFTYEQVMKVIGGGTLDRKGGKRIEKVIRAVSALAQELRAKRFAAGALDLEVPEAEVLLDDDGEMTGIVTRPYDESHQMIEECMVAANEAVAKELWTRGVKILARLHEPPEEEKLLMLRAEMRGLGVKMGNIAQPKVFAQFLKSIRKHPLYGTLSTMVLRSMKRAVYDSATIGHFGLAKKFYAHFTSPIRRYPDLTLHRQLADYLAAGGNASKAKRPPKLLAAWAAHTSEREEIATEAERGLLEIKKFRLLEAQLLTRQILDYDAVIVKCMPFGCFVEIPELAVSGLVHVSLLSRRYVDYNESDGSLSAPGGGSWHIGDRLRVHVAKVDFNTHRIDFVPVRKEGKGAARGKRGRRMLGLLAVVLGLVASAQAGNAFRVTPYVQDPAPSAMTLLWLAQTNGSAAVSWWKVGGAETNEIGSATQIEPSDRIANCRFTGEMRIDYCRAPELDYDCCPDASDNTRSRCDAWEMPYTCPWQYRCRLTGLTPDTTYGYRVTLAGGATYSKTFRTAPKTWRNIRFIYYSDSETEPKDNAESTGCTTDWGFNDGDGLRYYATQTACYASNIVHAVAFNPDLIVMAGDLAQKGSRQCDWDEFWRHNAGQLNDPAGSIPILASPGNHDYWSYLDGGNTGIAKYLSYFEFAPNGTGATAQQQELFHRQDYGPVAFIFIDANNGNDDVRAEDTNRSMNRTSSSIGSKAGCIAPDFHPGSVQYQWLAAQLADAQQTRAFTFVVCHQCPYSCGHHGGDPATGSDSWSGRPLRVLEPLFHRYGVDAWLCGHDEMMERSEIEGTEVLPDGTEVANTIQVWDMGIAGDGLRGGVINENPKEKFRAGKDAVERFDANGTLVDGGRHYGHMEVEVAKGVDGKWRATFSPTYVFVTTNAAGRACGFEKRTYDDVVTLVQRDIGGTTVRQWFHETTNTLGQTGSWTPAAPTVGGDRLLFDTEDDGSLAFTPNVRAPEGVLTRVSARICFGAAQRVPLADPTGEPQAGVQMALEDGVLRWAFLGADGWQICDVAGVTPDPATEYEIEVSLDHTVAPARVSYAFTTAQGTVLGWSGSARGEATRVNALSFSGTGSSVYLHGEYDKPVEPPRGLIQYLL